MYICAAFSVSARLELIRVCTITTINKTTIIMDLDDLPERMATLVLSTDDAKQKLKDWLDSSPKGLRFRRRFNIEYDELKISGDLDEMQVNYHCEYILRTCQWSGDERSLNGLPSELADHIFGPINEKVLCDSSRLKELILMGDADEFALGCYVDGKLRFAFFSDSASSRCHSQTEV